MPIIQLALSGKGLTEQNLGDLGINAVRPMLTTVAGASIPYPYGGKTRQVQIDLDPAALQSRGLSGQDVANALAAQNLIVPVGTQKIGNYEYTLQLNNAPSAIDDLARPADQDRQRHHDLHRATSPTCATATRRRPISCTSTATARY